MSGFEDCLDGYQVARSSLIRETRTKDERLIINLILIILATPGK